MKTLLSKSMELFEALVNIVYPERCAVCKKNLDHDIYPLCSGCMDEIRIIRPPCCPKCSRPMPHEGVCGECRKKNTRLDRTWACLLYEGIIKKCIHGFKYDHRLSLITVFRKFMFEFLLENPSATSADVIVPVPLYAPHLRERAYNHAFIIAREMAESFSLPLNDKNLIKIKNTRPQSELSKIERLVNLKGAFRVNKTKPFEKKRVLLVDDVYTTGATLNECARTLLQTGASKVSAFTLARGV